MVVTGMDRPGAQGDMETFEELVECPWWKVPVSGVTGDGFEDLGRTTLEALDVIRVYSKEPGKEPDRERPFTLPRNATVADLAATIHKDIAEELKYARLWGPSAHDGQSVRGGHVLEEGDVVEIHR
jgi:ribosome-interacting GTPase 1